jgi:hypothetical protein
MFKKILLLLLVLLVAIQFFHPRKNTGGSPPASSIYTTYNTPNEVKQLLNAGCNDCHSNNTRYPWYFKVQPVAWWMNNHIEEGKRELNFDEFEKYSPRRQYHKLESLQKEIKEGDMPMESYTWMHKNALLGAEQKQTLINWAEGIRKQLEQQFPMDSLIRKQ